MAKAQRRLGWDGVSDVEEDDPTDEEKRRISQRLDHSTTRTGDDVEPDKFYSRVEDI